MENILKSMQVLVYQTRSETGSGAMKGAKWKNPGKDKKGTMF